MIAEQVFSDAKARFHYTSDQVVWGRAEYWATLKELTAMPVMQGDCEDFASYCVGELRKAGAAARYVTCRVETGELHCVAECEGWILDNRQETILPLDQLRYQWMAMSGKHAGDAWHSLAANN